MCTFARRAALFVAIAAATVCPSSVARADSWDEAIGRAQERERENETTEERERRREKAQTQRFRESHPNGLALFGGAGAVHTARSRHLEPTVVFALGPAGMLQTSGATALQLRATVLLGPFAKRKPDLPTAETSGLLFGTVFDTTFRFVGTTSWFLAAGGFGGFLHMLDRTRGLGGGLVEGGARLGPSRALEIGVRAMLGSGDWGFSGLYLLTLAWCPSL
jgi:hypothetical protein